ncbi:MAG: hypothetical protein WC933_02820 [Candidatus Paceibacterota bacterium]|jgi:hypothetical protein
MFDIKYYNDKKQKLTQKANANLQEFINAGFKMVSEATDIQERIKEIEAVIAEKEETEKSKKK